ANIRVDDLAHCFRLCILSADEAQVSVALADADDHLFVRPWTPTALLAAHIGFINLHSAAEFFWRYFQHCRPNPMAEVPCRLVAYLQRALHLVGRHPFTAFGEQIRR